TYTIAYVQFTIYIMLRICILKPSKKLIDVAETAGLLNVSINSDDFHYGKGRNKKTPEAAETKDFVADKVQAIDTVAEPMAAQLKKDEMYDLLHDLEIPLSKVLVQMELKGIMIKTERLKEMEAELSEKLTAIEEKIYSLAGENFNINSPKQLGVILFE